MIIAAMMTLLAAMTAAEATKAAVGIVRTSATTSSYDSIEVRSSKWEEIAGAWRVDMAASEARTPGQSLRQIGNVTVWISSPTEFVMRDDWTFDDSRTITDILKNPLAPQPRLPRPGFGDDDDWDDGPPPRNEPRWPKAPLIAKRQIGVVVPPSPPGLRVPGPLAIGVAKSLAVKKGYRDVTLLSVTFVANDWEVVVVGRLKDGCGRAGVRLAAVTGMIAGTNESTRDAGDDGDCLADYLPGVDSIPQARAEAFAVEFATKRGIPNPVVNDTEWIRGIPDDEIYPHDAWQISIDGTDASLDLAVRATDGTVLNHCETRTGVAPEKGSIDASVAIRVVGEAVAKLPLQNVKVAAPRFVSVHCDGHASSFWRVDVTAADPQGNPVSDFAQVDANTGRRRDVELFRRMDLRSARGRAPIAVPSPTPDPRWAALPLLAKEGGIEGDAGAIEAVIAIARKVPMREMRISTYKVLTSPFAALRIEVRGRTPEGCGCLRVGLDARTKKPFELSIGGLQSQEWIERCDRWDVDKGEGRWSTDTEIDWVDTANDLYSVARDLRVRRERPSVMTVTRETAESEARAIAVKTGLKNAKPVAVMWRALPVPEWRVEVLGLSSKGCLVVTSRIDGVTGKPTKTFVSDRGPAKGCNAWYSDGEFEDGDPDIDQPEPPWP